MFQLTKEEMEDWKSQIAISNKVKMGLRKQPLAFTEQDVAMLSAVLRSNTAVKISVQIINAFVEMRRFISANAQIFKRLDTIEIKQLLYDEKHVETDRKIDIVLNAIESKEIQPAQGIFYNGQIFDAYKFVSDIIRTAKKSIMLIDNYIDDTVLTLFSKRRKNVNLIILTKQISKQLNLDVQKYNQQYPPAEVKVFKKAHDRFLIIDNNNSRSGIDYPYLTFSEILL